MYNTEFCCRCCCFYFINRKYDNWYGKLLSLYHNLISLLEVCSSTAIFAVACRLTLMYFGGLIWFIVFSSFWDRLRRHICVHFESFQLYHSAGIRHEPRNAITFTTICGSKGWGIRIVVGYSVVGYALEDSYVRFQIELEFVQCLANPNYLNCK